MDHSLRSLSSLPPSTVLSQVTLLLASTCVQLAFMYATMGIHVVWLYSAWIGANILSVHFTDSIYVSQLNSYLGSGGFGIWGMWPSFVIKLGWRVYIFMVCSMSHCYVGQCVPSASSHWVLGVNGEDLHLGRQAMPLVVICFNQITISVAIHRVSTSIYCGTIMTRSTRYPMHLSYRINNVLAMFMVCFYLIYCALLIVSVI